MKKMHVTRKTLAPLRPVDGLLDEQTASPEVALPEAPPPMIRCTICGSETQAGSADQMCWVCRRLKISAWHDVEQQMPAQE